MAYFQTEIEIQAPPELVWKVMRDVEHWHEWTPNVRSVRLLGGGPLAIGSRAIIRQPKLPPAIWRVTELDESRLSFTWVSSGPGIRVIARRFVERSGEASRATLSLRFSGMLTPLLVLLTRNLNERYLAMEANGLKARSESERHDSMKMVPSTPR